MKTTRSHRLSTGFSLIELMVALGILSVIIMAMLAMVQYMNQSLAQINAQQEVISLRSEISSAVSNSTTCQAAITGSPKFDFNLAQGPGMPTRITLPGGRVIQSNSRIGTIEIARLDFINAQLTGSASGVTRYRADIFLKVRNLRQSLGPSDLKGSTVASVNFSVASTGHIQSCSSSANLSSQLWSCSDSGGILGMLVGISAKDCCVKPNIGDRSGGTGGGRTLFKVKGATTCFFFCFGGGGKTSYDRLCIMD